MGKKIDQLITYLSLLNETFKFKEQQGLNTRYKSVDIKLPDDFIIHEVWEGASAEFSERNFQEIVFPAKDLPNRTKVARDHLRYLKKRSNGHKHGE